MQWKDRLLRFRSFWIFPLLSIALLGVTQNLEPASRLQDLLWLVPVGLLVWSALEYVLHRFIFHRHIRSRLIRTLISASHEDHHDAPQNVDYLLVRTPYAIVASTIVYSLLFGTTMNWFQAMGMMTGVWAGFLYYEYVHYRVHMTTGGTGIIALQRRAHFHHHFRAPDRCFGVTTPLWDYVLGTGREKR